MFFNSIKPLVHLNKWNSYYRDSLDAKRYKVLYYQPSKLWLSPKPVQLFLLHFFVLISLDIWFSRPSFNDPVMNSCECLSYYI